MNKFARHFLPLSLRVRFLLATAGVVLVLSLAYGIVALVGYSENHLSFAARRKQPVLYPRQMGK